MNVRNTIVIFFYLNDLNCRLGMVSFSCTTERKNDVPFSMAVRNGELMNECFHKQSRMGTGRITMTEDKETDEEGKKRGVSMV